MRVRRSCHHHREGASAEERHPWDEQQYRSRHLDSAADEPHPVGPAPVRKTLDVPFRAPELRATRHEKERREEP